MGVTTEPTGASPPRLNLNVYEENRNGWKVKCTLTPAIEGTNRAAYLGPGTYRTGRAWWPESVGFGPADPNHTEIYAILDAPHSDWSRRAELEHCNDWVQAHDLTLSSRKHNPVCNSRTGTSPTALRVQCRQRNRRLGRSGTIQEILADLETVLTQYSRAVYPACQAYLATVCSASPLEGIWELRRLYYIDPILAGEWPTWIDRAG
ncbi:MAG: hypothetical protein ACRERV_03015 [Methylococcales bacterium]